jgi:hypothetical protein
MWKVPYREDNRGGVCLPVRLNRRIMTDEPSTEELISKLSQTFHEVSPEGQFDLTRCCLNSANFYSYHFVIGREDCLDMTEGDVYKIPMPIAVILKAILEACTKKRLSPMNCAGMTIPLINKMFCGTLQTLFTRLHSLATYILIHQDVPRDLRKHLLGRSMREVSSYILNTHFTVPCIQMTEWTSLLLKDGLVYNPRFTIKLDEARRGLG